MKLLEKQFNEEIKQLAEKLHIDHLNMFDEPMDGDIVDEITNVINKELNVLNGNI